MLVDFKKFLLKTNALALAVGVILGTAVGKVRQLDGQRHPHARTVPSSAARSTSSSWRSWNVRGLARVWKRSLQLVDGNIGEALRQIYVAETFGPEAKARAKQMVENLRAELRDRIQKLDWAASAPSSATR